MVLHINPSGFACFDSEKEVCKFLEKSFLPKFRSVKPQYDFAPGSNCIIDYWAWDEHNSIPVLIEVKKWFVKIKHVEQIVKYLAHASGCYGGFPAKKLTYRFILICGGVHEYLREILEWLGVEIILTRQLLEGDF